MGSTQPSSLQLHRNAFYLCRSTVSRKDTGYFGMLVSSRVSPSQSGGNLSKAHSLVHVRVPAGLEELHERSRPVLAHRWSSAFQYLPEIDVPVNFVAVSALQRVVALMLRFLVPTEQHPPCNLHSASTHDSGSRELNAGARQERPKKLYFLRPRG